MVLLVSDIHLGRHGAEADRAIERDLVALLRAQEGSVERLFLLGDVFDYYIEYRNVVPKGFVRLQGLLAEWSDGGVPITYLAGNHDPWHVRYFSEELGVRFVEGPIYEPLYDRQVYMTHGDNVAPHGIIRGSMRFLLRHPVPVWIYRNAVPADLGIFLARKSSELLGYGSEVEPAMVEAMRRFARRELATGRADTVIMAHSHRAEHHRWPDGDYLNTGCWYRERTFGRLSDKGLELCRWDGHNVLPHA